MPMGMALNVDRHGKARDVARGGFNQDGKRRCPATEALGTNAQRIHTLQELSLQLRKLGIQARPVDIAKQCPFRQDDRQLEVSTQSNSHNHRGTGIGACTSHALNNCSHHSLASLGRRKHAQPTHVLRAPTLREKSDRQVPALDLLQVHNGRGIVTRVISPQGM
jgi:hypothetical protein